MKKEEVLKHFINDEGKLFSLPKKLKKKIEAVKYVFELSNFKKGIEYSEKEIKEIIINKIAYNDDTEIIRYMVDMRLLDRKRDCSVYRVGKDSDSILKMNFDDLPVNIG